MGSTGDAYDNAMAESFFATLQREVLNRRRFAIQAEAQMAIFQWLEGRYNPCSALSSAKLRSRSRASSQSEIRCASTAAARISFGSS